MALANPLSTKAYSMKHLLPLCSFLLISLFSVAQPVRDTTLTGYTRTRLTPLYYGLGTDRLGGARMETLDSAVVLNITGYDTTRRFWRVRLAPTLTGFVPIEQTATDTALTYPRGALSANWRVWGDTTGGPTLAQFDYVAVSLPARLPYRSRQEVNPSRLVIDVFGVTSNTNWITQLKSVKGIKNVWFEQVADDVFRVFIELSQLRHWGYSIYYQRNTLMIRVRRAPESKRLRGLVIAVDAGHGGSNTGARGEQSKKLEKELTLDVAKRLKSYFERSGATVIMTRTTDTNIGPTDRIKAMRWTMPHLLVSIHFNASGSASVRGFSTYYKHLGFRPLSQAVLQELRKVDNHEFGNVGHFNFFFNSPTDYPNVLVEGPFLSNPVDESLILNEAFRQKMAKAIWRGVKKWRR